MALAKRVLGVSLLIFLMGQHADYVLGQEPTPSPSPTPQASPTPDKTDPSKSPLERAFERLEWRSIGPANMGGRIADVEGVPGNPNVVYVASGQRAVYGRRQTAASPGSRSLNGRAQFRSATSHSRRAIRT